MDIASFADLLHAARAQNEPQRLLFIFAAAELPDDATKTQQERFLAKRGGALTPVVYVDKSPDEIGTFVDLVEESNRMGVRWDIVFVTSMPAQGGYPPDSEQIEQTFARLIEMIRLGQIDSFLPFDREGDIVRLYQR
ncbi:hypothetical protein [Thiomonas bhubaneswarensis]|uniref:Uncharacterized protein n=1 Tax=Thiomonas bhubaneswarensis TaxID=339866 RepID=A0A0K6I7Y5_9BURK|nr:hypothetical protein [Thiomonas bhubaneswarensis]CUA99437.1 hypothetical protein Ga0061069_109120 [Thiomonas bhubaneswarensis]